MGKKISQTEQKKMSLSTDEIKGEILRQVIEDKWGRGAIGEFAALIKYGRHTITKWTQGIDWQERLEPLLEHKLALPFGFFAAIGAGKDIRQFVNVSDPDAISEEQYRALLRLSSTDPEAQRKIEQTKALLRQQVQHFVNLHLPENPTLKDIAKLWEIYEQSKKN